MDQSSHRSDNAPLTQNQNNNMSDDPGDGGRKSFTTGPDGTSPAEDAPDAQDQSTIEAFGRAGAGIAPKE